MSADPKVITVFRTRLDPEHVDEYTDRAGQIAALAVEMPGYIMHKGFTAPDGERVTIVEFDSAEHQQAWAEHPEHLQAMGEGTERFYTEYSLTVATVTKASRFSRG